MLNGQSHISNEFDPLIFFARNLRATGMFIDRFGVVKRRFAMSATGTTAASSISLHETFNYNNSDVEDRIWHISKRSDNRFEGRTDVLASDCIGTVHGPLFSWSCHFYLKMFSHRLKVHFDDVMVRLTPDTVLNRARVTKWGLLLGDVHLTFQRLLDTVKSGKPAILQTNALVC